MPAWLHAFVALAALAVAFAHPLPNKHFSADTLDLSNPPACNDINHCRTMWDIVWSCVTTIFLCTWVSLHPELPDPRFTKWRVAVVRVFVVCVSFLIPEMVVGQAINQWVEVQWYKSTPPFVGWTETHSFLAIMGGFIHKQDVLEFKTIRAQPIDRAPGLFRRTNPPSNSPSNPPATQPSPTLSSLRRFQQWLLATPPASASASKNTYDRLEVFISKDEILDKSKGSSIAKFLTVVQTTWFMLQIIERWAAHQPRTQLEIMTLAYAILNIIIYTLWWNKPLNVDEPIQVSLDRDWRPPPTKKIGVWSNNSFVFDAFMAFEDHGKHQEDTPLETAVVVFIAVLFGGVHCFAWGFHFPTTPEETLWRVCAIYCTTAPVVVALLMLTAEEEVRLIRKLIVWIMVSVYVSCRVILFVVTFTCLRSSPPGIFVATTWTRLLPHVG